MITDRIGFHSVLDLPVLSGATFGYQTSVHFQEIEEHTKPRLFSKLKVANSNNQNIINQNWTIARLLIFV